MTQEFADPVDQIRPVPDADDQFLHGCEVTGVVDVCEQYSQLVAGRIAETHCGKSAQQGTFARNALSAFLCHTFSTPLLGPLG